MRESIEYISPDESLESFSSVVDTRAAQLDFLTGQFEVAMGMIENMDAINEVIAMSPRPELVMTQVVPQMPIESPYKLGYINNFTPNLTGFGIRVFKDEEDVLSGKIEKKFVGREVPDRATLDEYFFLGARGGYKDYVIFAKENGIEEMRAVEVLMMSHADREAFMRMWILFPDLTERIITTAVQKDPSEGRTPIAEEIYVAYSIMSRLVDISDIGAVKEDGSFDDWLLCH